MTVRYRQRNSVFQPILCGVRSNWAPIEGWYTSFDQVYDPAGSLDGTATIIERCWDETHPGPPFRSGGPFRLLRGGSQRNVQGQSHYETKPYRYVGGFVPTTFGTAVSQARVDNIGNEAGAFSQDDGDLASFGASAWKKFKPKTTIADLGTFIGEIHEVPNLIKGMARRAKNAARIWKDMGGFGYKANAFSRVMDPTKIGDKFLELQFGWLPLVSDIRKFYNGYANFQRMYANLIAHNGSWLKRGGDYTAPIVTTTGFTETTATASVYPTLPTPMYDPIRITPASGAPYWRYGQSRLYTVNYSRVWFEARFKYWIPALNLSGDDAYRETINIMRTFGARVNPSLVWELTPWSWLVDYFSNAGDVIDNLSSQLDDNLVSKYAYIMGHVLQEARHEATVYMKGGPVNMQWSRTLEAKRRLSANPFGFSFTDGTLSPRQRMILMALGMARAG